MIDYMLKFDSKEQAEEVLVGAGVLQRDEDQVFGTMGHAVDIIGTIYKPDGTFTEGQDGLKIANHQPVDGYHINLRTNNNFDELLAAYTVTPTTPHRVWA